jgi:YHS domain-containing protein
VEQPGARPGDETYCPVSGVVFRVTPESARRESGGATRWFCCEACAGYFEKNAARVSAARRR